MTNRRRTVQFRSGKPGRVQPQRSAPARSSTERSLASLTVKLPVIWPEPPVIGDWMTGDEDVWSKVSCPERLSLAGPPYDDVVPFQREIVETFPDRVLWGTDWPHPNLKSHMVDDGVLVDQIPKFAVTEDLRRRLLVDNPMRLYWAD